MEQYVIPIVLVLGLAGAALLTKWFNWYAWGENRRKQELRRMRMEARAKAREKDEDEKSGAEKP